MNPTRIDWADYTWNPLTGCKHGCEYCYARKIAVRFGTMLDEQPLKNGCYVCKSKIKGNPYPHIFEPTLHPYRLGEPGMMKKPQTIFVCSMADLFGDWVPEDWILTVFKACLRAPQHRYLFLTKNPKRYCELCNNGLTEFFKNKNFWFGTTVTKHGDHYFSPIGINTFLSIEPLLENLDAGIGSFGGTKWIIVGAETGDRKNKVVPEKAWVDNICEAAALTGAKVFMKESLREIMGNEFVQEFPWRVE